MFKFLKRLRGDKPIETPAVIEEVVVVEPVVEAAPEPVVEEVKVEAPKPEVQKAEKPKPVEILRTERLCRVFCTKNQTMEPIKPTAITW